MCKNIHNPGQAGLSQDYRGRNTHLGYPLWAMGPHPTACRGRLSSLIEGYYFEWVDAMREIFKKLQNYKLFKSHVLY